MSRWFGLIHSRTCPECTNHSSGAALSREALPALDPTPVLGATPRPPALPVQLGLWVPKTLKSKSLQRRQME